MGVGGGVSFLVAFCLVFPGVLTGACSAGSFFVAVSSAGDGDVVSNPAIKSSGSRYCGMVGFVPGLADDGSAGCERLISIAEIEQFDGVQYRGCQSADLQVCLQLQ